MKRMRLSFAFTIVALLLIAPAALTQETGQTAPPPPATESAPATEATAVPPNVAPNVGPYAWTYGPFKYDPSGNVIAIGSDYYVYDTMSRLVTGGVNRPDQAGTQIHTYGYDVYGNRVSVNGQSQPVNADNRMTAYGSQYDPAGNLQSWQPPGSAVSRVYTYDALNKLVKEVAGDRTMLHLYTADDARVWSMESIPDGRNISHWTVRDLDGRILRDFLDDGTDVGDDWKLYREYVYRGGALLAVNIGNGFTEHVTVDHLGSPRLVTDGNRYKLFNHYYLPFGEEWTIGGEPTDLTRLRFTGHERDNDLRGEVSGTLDFMSARYYSSRTGRFLSIDSANADPENPQTWNRYTYTWNNPMGLVDGNGEEPLDPALRLFLEGWYGTSFARVQVHGGWFARLLANRNEAITFGNHVFLNRENWKYYKAIHDKNQSENLAVWVASLLGHEVKHTLQARPTGVTLFVIRYLGQWVSVGFDYNKIPFEIQAKYQEQDIAMALLENPEFLIAIIDAVVAALVNNGSTVTVTYQGAGTSGWETIYFSNQAGGMSLSDLFSFDGVLFIDGVNMTGVFTDPTPMRGGRR